MKRNAPTKTIASPSESIANPLDPNAVVTYATAVWGSRNASEYSGRSRTSPTNDQNSIQALPTLADGLAQNRAVNRRNKSNPVLDALAAISVALPQEVFAIALQLTPPNISLYIAGNNEVPQTTLNYLVEVWTRLKAISDAHAKSRKGTHWNSLHGRQPEREHTDTTDALELDLMALIHRHTHTRFRKRFKKHFGILNKYIEMATSIDSDEHEANPEEEEEEEENEHKVRLAKLVLLFNSCIMALTEVDVILSMFDATPWSAIQKKDWVNYFRWMKAANRISRSFLADESGAELLAQRTTGGPLPIRRALKKITSLFRHIGHLIKAARSPRRRCIFVNETNFRVVPVPARADVSLPKMSNKAWRDLSKSLCDEQPVMKRNHRTPPVEKTTGLRPHCECALIAYLHDSAPSAAVLSYIGVSKLSCAPCFLWIDAYNSVCRANYVTSGTHSKWYWRWSVPDLRDVKIGNAVGDILAKNVGRIVCEKLSENNTHARAP